MTYNRAIFEKEGWALPQSLEEIPALREKAEAAGYRFCLNQMQYPGYGFQYMCNIADTDYLSTVGGLKWQKAFLRGETMLADSPEMLKCFEIINKWREYGLLSGEGDPSSVLHVRDLIAEGDTLFMIGSANDFSAYGEDVASQFGLMPHLSEDGSQNVFILNVSRYYGLSKRLKQPGQEQRLEEALHVMEILSTTEGLEALNASLPILSLEALKHAPVKEMVFYSDPLVTKALNEGYTASFIYSGWENVMVEYGNKMYDFMLGKCDIEDLIRCIDDNQHLVTQDNAKVYTTVTETVQTEDCARLVGIAFGEAVDADAALVSINAYYGMMDDLNLNREGGALFQMEIGDMEITSILPTGWSANIQTVMLTGARIKEPAQNGYEMEADGVAYPYVLETKGGMTLADDKAYTVVICGATDAVKEEGHLTDTGVMGLDAARTYFSRFDTFRAKDIMWN